MEPYFIGLLAIIFVFGVILICLLLGKSSRWNYAERVKRRKWNKYIQSLNPENEKAVLSIIKSSSDAEFNLFLNSIMQKNKLKYDPYTFSDITLFKRSLYNVVNKYTERLDPERLKRIETVFPMLKRVYFGPRLNNKVYNRHTLKRKFKFTIKSGETIPRLESVLDVAQFLNTSVNKILGICYMQGNHYGSHYIKKKQIYEGLKLKNLDVNNLNYSQIPLDSTFIIPEEKKLKKSYSTKKESDPHAKLTDEPSFIETNSPFYKRKFLIKPDGRRRLIACPASFLKIYQRLILAEILEKAELSGSCTGFMKNKSIVTNAQNHVRAQTLVKIDLKNFFNSMKFYHAFEVFRGFGYNRPVSAILACICTDWYGYGGRYVPQGAPSSPMIGNLYASHLDKRLEGLWSKKGFFYSRYADDLTFSNLQSRIPVRGLIHASYEIIKDEKLYPNFDKTKVLRKQHRKNVTGITINEKINIERQWMNIFRGELYRFAKYGLPQESSLKRKVYNQLTGKFAFLKMVNPAKAEKYQTYLDEIQLD